MSYTSNDQKSTPPSSPTLSSSFLSTPPHSHNTSLTTFTESPVQNFSYSPAQSSSPVKTPTVTPRKRQGLNPHQTLLALTPDILKSKVQASHIEGHEVFNCFLCDLEMSSLLTLTPVPQSDIRLSQLQSMVSPIISGAFQSSQQGRWRTFLEKLWLNPTGVLGYELGISDWVGNTSYWVCSEKDKITLHHELKQLLSNPSSIGQYRVPPFFLLIPNVEDESKNVQLVHATCLLDGINKQSEHVSFEDESLFIYRESLGTEAIDYLSILVYPK